jgi:hypothetical protein
MPWQQWRREPRSRSLYSGPTFTWGGLQWGYASWVGATTWFTIAAPYFCDLITVFVALLIILEVGPPRRWLWLNLLIIGVVSPLVNSAYNYSGGLRGSFNDVGVLLRDLNPVAVHLYFAITLVFHAWRFYHCYLRRKTWHPA